MTQRNEQGEQREAGTRQQAGRREQPRERYREAGWVKIVFPLVQDVDGYPPASAEFVWARPVEGGYELDNIPFFARGVSSGDVVAAEDQNGELVFGRVVRPSGNSTARVLLHNAADVTGLQPLWAMGCESEVSHLPTLVAINVPAHVNYGAVRALLGQGEADGRWEYEEAAIADHQP